jgi:hypothetical protein
MKNRMKVRPVRGSVAQEIQVSGSVSDPPNLFIALRLLLLFDCISGGHLWHRASAIRREPVQFHEAIRLAAGRVQTRVGDFFSRSASVSQNRASCRLNGGNWRDDGHVASASRSTFSLFIPGESSETEASRLASCFRELRFNPSRSAISAG